MTANQKIAALIAVIILSLLMYAASLFPSDYEEAAKLQAWEADTRALAIERIKANKESQLTEGS